MDSRRIVIKCISFDYCFKIKIHNMISDLKIRISSTEPSARPKLTLSESAERIDLLTS